jgi:BlaI family penicillinase repressor
MSRSRISEAEWEVMEVIWQRSPISASGVVEELVAKTAWAPTTIRTMLSRLVEKKVLAMHKLDEGVSFTPLISREQCVQQEGESFVSRVFGGASKPLLLHFVKRAKLSPEEIRELQNMLRKKGKS